MRITGGEYGGRLLSVPKSDSIRPTQDRVREALFSILQTAIAGADFLDLFAGSGAVGFEALSRGARRAVFVESDREHLATLNANARALRVPPDRFETVCADAYRWLKAYSGPGFSVAFADPPYALGRENGYAGVLETLAAGNTVVVGGLFAAEMTSVQDVAEAAGWELLRDRVYGKTRICIWRRNK
ncbi:MAG: 16S rRNA (guanine(966)-N(2))-methyltransferase RsmD [Kiritimatiellae bacterium]|nr:16S rRNA (guanine(966)-N(2))-methyltransferase RsmD [Kiritimatiellia bacterium]